MAAAIRLSQQHSCSFNHLVGAHEHAERDFEAERLGGPHVDYQLVLGRRLYRQVGRLLALQNAVDVADGAPVLIGRGHPPPEQRYEFASFQLIELARISQHGPRTCSRASIWIIPLQRGMTYDENVSLSHNLSRCDAHGIVASTKPSFGTHIRPDRRSRLSSGRGAIASEPA